jgi:hypothetical protein
MRAHRNKEKLHTVPHQIRLAMNLFTLLQKPKSSVPVNANIDSFSNLSPFETQVRNQLFPSDRYTLVEHSIITLKVNDHRQPCTNPAFKLLDQQTGKSFWLEVKSCTQDWNSRIQWCTELQLRKYLSCHKKTPTFLLLNIQNDGKNSLYLLSMTQARFACLHDSCIKHFEIPAFQPITSEKLWAR